MSTTGHGTAVVTVDDDGPGIPAEFRDRIFGRFERAEREHGAGTGLGLAISREIVARHNGRIWFEDRAEGGTRFAVALDLLDERPPTAAAGGTRLLICEDDADIAETLRRLVEAMGYTADRVGTVAAARIAVRDGTYGILLLDLQLPDGTGLGLLQSLRAPDGTLPMPVIVISARADDGPGAPVPRDIVDWIDKPVDPERLAAALHAAGAGMPTRA